MARPKKKTISEPKAREIAMILRLNISEHKWVQNISNASELSMPNVVKLILNEAMKHDASTYIAQVKKASDAERAKALAEQIEQAQAELRKLQSN